MPTLLDLSLHQSQSTLNISSQTTPDHSEHSDLRITRSRKAGHYSEHHPCLSYLQFRQSIKIQNL